MSQRKDPQNIFIITHLLALPTTNYQGKDVVFRFIIEYSSLRDFYRPLGNNNNNNNNRSIYFYMRIFEKMIFWLVLKLEI
jgi:hypothetical protein